MSLCGFAFLYINTYFSARLVSHEKNSSTKLGGKSDKQSFPRGHVGVVFNQCVVFSFLIIYFAGSSNGRTHPSGGCYRGELG